jgi:protocatechuate 3,4-dioxygenase beta subunit
VWLAAALLTLVATAGWFFLARPDAVTPSRERARSGDAPNLSVLQRVLSLSPPVLNASGELRSIRGTVQGPKGPVPGARVIATVAVAGESLSVLPCGGIRGRTLVECTYRRNGRELIQLVAERRGEVLVRAETVTAVDGTFSLSGLEEGPYALWAESQEGIAFRPSVAAGSEAVELRLGAGGRLSGIVTDRSQAPIPGVLVTAVFASHSRFFETLTDDQGRYQLGPLPPGLLVAVIAKPGLLTSVDLVGTFTPEVKRNFVLSEPGRITGRVLREKAPVAGIEVYVTNDDDLHFSVLTDAKGHFSVEGLFRDFYSLTVQQADMGASASVTLDADTLNSDVTLELRPSAFIEGLVRGEDQRPLDKAEVSALWEGPEDPDTAEGSSEEEEPTSAFIAYADEAGRYRLGPMPPGRYALVAREGTHLELEQEPQAFPQGHTARDFTLKRALLVEGVLVDPQGLPVMGEWIHLRAVDEPGSRGTDRTGEDGRFFLSAPQPGQYELSVKSERVHPLEMTITVPTEPLRIVVEPTLRLEVEVVDETGTPLPAVEVGIWPEQASPRDRPVDIDDTDGEGRASLHVTTPGRYGIAAELFSMDFLRTASRTVEVDRKGETRVRLQFEEGRRLSGQVVDWRGRPLSKVFVQHQAAPRPVFPRGGMLASVGVQTDSDGRFMLQQVSGEQFDACVRSDIYVPLTAVHGEGRCVRVKNDGEEVRIVLGRAVFVTGRLVHPDGSPVTHFRVNGREVRREDGELSLPIQQPGVERIELSAPGYPATLRTAPEFPEGEHIQDLGTIVLGP